MGSIKWFKKRGYRHFDRPVCEAFAAKAMQPSFVAQHAFSPLIHYEKQEKRYKYCDVAKKRVIATKNRLIRYSSHRDACILAYYASQLAKVLDVQYQSAGLTENVIAYRALGKANYAFAAEAFEFARAHSPVVILAFDVAGFFGNLDHGLSKARLRRVLDTVELPSDWYKIYKFMTKFNFVRRDELVANSIFGQRISEKSREPIATVAELRTAKIAFYSNPTPGKGIPQGTPISATFSNLYMLDYDRAAKSYCDNIGAFYRRYSDDILVICELQHAEAVETTITYLLGVEKLSLNPSKIERSNYDLSSPAVFKNKAAQYLGFNIDETGATIRQSSLARHWRKMRRAFRRTRKVADAAMASGQANKVWTKRLRRRFTANQFRNFQFTFLSAC